MIRRACRAGPGSRLQQWMDAGSRAIARPAAVASVLAVFWSTSPCPGAADFGAAFLDNGVGVRAQGMGGAFAAVADDASAVFWNPAGLARARGADALLSNQRMSLDRKQYSLAASTNSRGGLGFGFAWLYAGVDKLDARTGWGDIFGLNVANFFVDDYLWKFPRVDIFYYNDGLCSFAGFGRWVSVIGKVGCSSDIRSNSFQQQGFFNGNFGGLYSFSEHCIFMVPVAVLPPKCSWD